VSEIVFIMAIAPLLTPDNQIKGLAISVIIGGLAQLVIQWPQIRNMGWHLRWKLNFNHPGLKRIGLLMIPALIGLSVDQINAFVDTICASFLQQGSITALYYSNRVMQLPLAIFGIAFSSVALPAMSKAVAESNISALKETFNFAVRFVIFILIPSAIGLMVIGFPIIHVLFERGQFDRHATLLTNSALFYYSLGLPAYAIAKIVASAFYSHQETKTPVKIAAIAMIINAILCIILMRFMGVGGLALASAVASYFNACALIVLLRRKIGLLGITRIVKTAAKTLIAGIIMAIVSYLIAFHLFVNKPLLGLVLALAGGIGVYFLMAIILNMEERKPLLNFFKNDGREYLEE
ncbi:MAG: murein biosynthesis integral membrane protein MurJ, partial [Elusimicrobia bacterium]|nr:murein biosynthesis integral membrane protein MurJ [Elusimicrobiota bacterium]